MAPENEFWYGDCGYMIGAKIVKIYRRTPTPMGIMALNPTLVLIFSRESTSPAKNRNRDMWRRPGTASATLGMYHLSDPSCKYCRRRAPFKGSLYCWKTRM